MARHGSRDVDADYPMLRSLLMGAVYAMVLPNVGMPLAPLRAELFARYGLDWDQGVPPDTQAPGGTCDTDFSRFFATGRPAPDQPPTADEPKPAREQKPWDRPPEPADEPKPVDQSK